MMSRSVEYVVLGVFHVAYYLGKARINRCVSSLAPVTILKAPEVSAQSRNPRLGLPYGIEKNVGKGFRHLRDIIGFRVVVETVGADPRDYSLRVLPIGSGIFMSNCRTYDSVRTRLLDKIGR